MSLNFDFDVDEELLAAFQHAADALQPKGAVEFKPLPHQVPPPPPWRLWVLFGGRGSGKTAASAKYVHDHVHGPPCLPDVPGGHWISIVAPTLGDAVTSCVTGPSGLRLHDPDVKVMNRPGGLICQWGNGTEAKLFGANSPEDVERFRAGGNRCLSEDTRLLTGRGWIRMDEVVLTDVVMTRQGWRNIDKCGVVDPDTEIWEMILEDGRTVKGTPDHRFFLESGRQVELHHLVPGDKLASCSLEMVSQSLTTVSGGRSRPTATTPTSLEELFILMFGNNSMERFQRVMSYITRTRTSGTTALETLSALIARLTMPTTLVPATGMPLVAEQQSGLLLPRSTSVSTAESSSLRNDERLYAVGNATTPVVQAVKKKGRGPVYCVRVPEIEEFYAEGILSSNCLVWAEEMAAWRYLEEAWQQIRYGLRVGPRPHAVASTTPRSRKLIKELMEDPRVVVTHGTTDSNPYLDASVKDELYEDYGGTRMGRQELEGELLEDVENALWNGDVIERNRFRDEKHIPEMYRKAVAVDPAASEGGDEHGIVVGGVSRRFDFPGILLPDQTHGFIVEDCSVHGHPNTWGKRAIRAYYEHECDLIVCEVNNGGDMVINTIKSIDPNVPVKSVWASRGKTKRAEPVSSLYQQGRVHHVGQFPELEDQMTTWDSVDPDPAWSPDRMDALVWLLTEIMLGGGQVGSEKMQDNRLKNRR